MDCSPTWILLTLIICTGVFAVKANLDEDAAKTLIERPRILFEFDLYRQKFNKRYASSLETSRRLKIFIVKSYRAFKSYVSYTFGRRSSFWSINQFSDRTSDEIKQYFKWETHSTDFTNSELQLENVDSKLFNEGLDRGFLDLVRSEFGRISARVLSSADSVEHAQTSRNNHLDLRELNCFGAPKDQGDCGSCYAFVTIAMFEHLHCLKTGKYLAFSEQFLVDCGSEFGLMGCSGGQASSSIKMVQKTGLELESSRPYKDREEKCDATVQANFKTSRIKIEGQVGGSLVEAGFFKRVLSLKRPIYVSIRIQEEPFLQYGGGIDCPEINDDTDVAHAMLIVGSGVEAGVEFWILRNSLGVDWGEKGHYRLKKDDKYFVGQRGFSLVAPLDDFEFVEQQYC